jgi:hypothetical protein
MTFTVWRDVLKPLDELQHLEEGRVGERFRLIYLKSSGSQRSSEDGLSFHHQREVNFASLSFDSSAVQQDSFSSQAIFRQAKVDWITLTPK